MSRPLELPRAELLRLCELLGHDPDRVAEIRLTAREVEVVYMHRVTR